MIHIRKCRKNAYRLSAFFLSVILLLQSIPNIEAVTTETTGTHTLYAGPTEQSAVSGVLSDGDTVTVIEHINDTWSRIRLPDGTVGCCDRTILGIQPSETEHPAGLIKAAYTVRVLSSPDRRASVIGVLPENARPTVVSKLENGFTLVQLGNSRLGYIPSASLETIYEQTAVIRTVPKLTASTGITTEKEAAARLTELSAYFQNGRYWNCRGTGLSQSADNLFCVTDSPCAHASYGYSYCNVYTSSMSEYMGYYWGTQCLGYAALLSDLTFGTDAPISMHSDFEKLRVGDHIRLVLWDHSMLVTEVGKDENGKTYVYVTEVNADYDTCKIEWGRKFTQQDLHRLGDYVEIYTRYPTEDAESTEMIEAN